MAEKLVGKDIVPLDLVAKITGRARYAEDFRVDGMVFARLLASPMPCPMPHARVLRIDAGEALAMDGVLGILTANEVPAPEAPGEAALTMEPRYEGEAILALAAVDETTAADAIEKIQIDFEPLPFVLNPLDSLRPDGPNGRTEGNTAIDGEMTTLKWTEADFSEAGEGRLAIRRINAPDSDSRYGPDRTPISSAFVREALDEGGELFGWEERLQRSGKQNGTKITGVGMGLSAYSAGSREYDGLLVIRPDGRLYIH